MKKLIIKWIIFALVIMATCYLPGIQVENFWYAMLVAAVLTVVNVTIKPIIKVITLPINFITLGLFSLIINLGILYAIGYFIPQYTLDNPLSVFIASIIIAISFTILKKI